MSFGVVVENTSLINRCLEFIDMNTTHVLDSPDLLSVASDDMNWELNASVLSTGILSDNE